MKVKFYAMFLIAGAAMTVIGCKKGDQGPVGPTGATGQNGAPGQNGQNGAPGTPANVIYSPWVNVKLIANPDTGTDFENQFASYQIINSPAITKNVIDSGGVLLVYLKTGDGAVIPVPSSLWGGDIVDHTPSGFSYGYYPSQTFKVGKVEFLATVDTNLADSINISGEKLRFVVIPGLVGTTTSAYHGGAISGSALRAMPYDQVANMFNIH